LDVDNQFSDLTFQFLGHLPRFFGQGFILAYPVNAHTH
jgi:hypothetical protein